VIVAYNLPDRDSCGKFSAANGPSEQGYRAWIRQLAAAIGAGHDIVIVEPSPAWLAGPLKRAGIQFGRGFSANVSNFEWTSVMVGWSQRLERALGGNVGAVIDTSRNGSGPYTGGDAPQWCNPPGRSTGPPPRVDPGPAGIDAYLWIKNPGVSDGPCNGGPAAGQFYLQYAMALAQARERIQDS
jgi:endoglucanase